MAGMNVDGLVSGIDTAGLITQLMQLERQPQVRLAAKRTAANAKASVYQTLNTRVAAMQDAAAALAKATGFQATKATSSAADVVTATSQASAAAGSLSFTVERLASAHSLISVGSVASTDAVITTPGSNLLLGAGGALGLATIAGSADLAAGAHTIEVSQATSGAGQAGTALADTTTIAIGDTLDVVVSGATRSVTLTAGTYGRSALAEMVTAASGGELRATVGTDGGLVVTTAREGSAASLQVTQGAALGFAGPTATSQGTDGIVLVDGAATTVTDTAGPMVLAAGGGASVTATSSGGLRVATMTADNISTGDGTLAGVAAGINAAGVGMTATAVQVAPGAYRLQVASATTGSAGRLSLALDSFTGLTMTTLSEGVDARMAVGTGAAAFTITSGSNTVSDALPGVTFGLRKVSADPVTVTVTTDVDALAGRVGAMVDAVNATLFNISSQSGYDAGSKKGGALLGDVTSRSLHNQLRRTIGDTVGLKGVGIEFNKDGTIKFDKAAFAEAHKNDPAAVAAVFQSEALGADGAKVGLAHRLEALGKQATDPIDGTITTAIKGRKAAADRLGREVEAWDTRLAAKEKVLRRQFTGLEVALGKLRDQSSWLAGQLAGLSANNG